MRLLISGPGVPTAPDSQVHAAPWGCFVSGVALTQKLGDAPSAQTWMKSAQSIPRPSQPVCSAGFLQTPGILALPPGPSSTKHCP